VKLHQIHAVGLQPLEASVDAHLKHFRIPVGTFQPRGMPAFGEQEELIPPTGNRISDLLFAVGIAFAGIDHVQTGVESGVEKPIDIALWRTFESNLGSAESQYRDEHICTAKSSLFHLHRTNAADSVEITHAYF